MTLGADETHAALGTDGASVALHACWSCRSLFAHRAHVALVANGTGITSAAIFAFGPGVAFVALGSPRTEVTRCAASALCALLSFASLGPSWSLLANLAICALEASLSGDTGTSFVATGAWVSFGTGQTWWSTHLGWRTIRACHTLAATIALATSWPKVTLDSSKPWRSIDTIHATLARLWRRFGGKRHKLVHHIVGRELLKVHRILGQAAERLRSFGVSDVGQNGLQIRTRRGLHQKRQF